MQRVIAALLVALPFISASPLAYTVTAEELAAKNVDAARMIICDDGSGRIVDADAAGMRPGTNIAANFADLRSSRRRLDIHRATSA